MHYLNLLAPQSAARPPPSTPTPLPLFSFYERQFEGSLQVIPTIRNVMINGSSSGSSSSFWLRHEQCIRRSARRMHPSQMSLASRLRMDIPHRPGSCFATINLLVISLLACLSVALTYDQSPQSPGTRRARNDSMLTLQNC